MSAVQYTVYTYTVCIATMYVATQSGYVCSTYIIECIVSFNITQYIHQWHNIYLYHCSYIVARAQYKFHLRISFVQYYVHVN